MYVQITDCTVQPAVGWGVGVEMGPIERNGAEVKRGSFEVCLCQNGTDSSELLCLFILTV